MGIIYEDDDLVSCAIFKSCLSQPFSLATLPLEMERTHAGTNSYTIYFSRFLKDYT